MPRLHKRRSWIIFAAFPALDPELTSYSILFCLLWRNTHHIKFTILAIFKGRVQWHWVHSYCANITTIPLQNISLSQTETLQTLNSNPHSHRLLVTTSLHSDYEFDNPSWNHIIFVFLRLADWTWHNVFNPSYLLSLWFYVFFALVNIAIQLWMKLHVTVGEGTVDIARLVCTEHVFLDMPLYLLLSTCSQGEEPYSDLTSWPWLIGSEWPLI